MCTQAWQWGSALMRTVEPFSDYSDSCVSLLAVVIMLVRPPLGTMPGVGGCGSESNSKVQGVSSPQRELKAGKH